MAERKIRYSYDVTLEIQEVMEQVCEDYLVDEYDRTGKFTSDMKETLYEKMEGTPLKNGDTIDLGIEFGTPAMKKLNKLARNFLKQG